MDDNNVTKFQYYSLVTTMWLGLVVLVINSIILIKDCIK
jgi:hypothetical protein